MNKNDKKIKFLGRLYINFKRSEISYQNYMNNNKKYIFARIIKSCNEESVNILMNNSSLLSNELISDSIKLISYFDIWIEKWNDLENINRPNLDDEFIFENTFTFPRDAAKRLEKEYLELRNKKN
jgi:hypothetical protein